MKRNTTTIEINGQRYDAHTGEKVAVLPKSVKTSGKSTDGMVKTAAPSAFKPEIALAVPPSHAPQLPAMGIRRSATTKAMEVHTQQPSTTLVRQGLAKPLKNQPLFKAQTPHRGPAVQQQAAIVPKLSAQQINPRRHKQAAKISKSQLVSHFRELPANLVTPSLQPATPLRGQSVSAPLPLSSRTAATSPGMDIFERALAQATAHEQPRMPLPRASREKRLAGRLAAIASVVVLAVVIGGFVVYQNSSNISLYVASARAGFQASLPGYRPAGYTIGNLASSAGSVAVNYHDPNNHNFAILEKPSDWDSATLQDSFVIPEAGQDFETLQTGDQTIFVYGQQHATWVNGGIWYQLQSGSTLTNQQLSQLASTI